MNPAVLGKVLIGSGELLPHLTNHSGQGSRTLLLARQGVSLPDPLAWAEDSGLGSPPQENV